MWEAHFLLHFGLEKTRSDANAIWLEAHSLHLLFSITGLLHIPSKVWHTFLMHAFQMSLSEACCCQFCWLMLVSESCCLSWSLYCFLGAPQSHFPMLISPNIKLWAYWYLPSWPSAQASAVAAEGGCTQCFVGLLSRGHLHLSHSPAT